MGALDGLKVLDLTSMVSGPVAAMMMADQGARVIKVEPLVGEQMRHIGGKHNDVSPAFYSCNRGKESISLDLKSEEGKKILLELAADADVFIQNFRPGAIERMGFGEDVLRENNKKLILCLYQWLWREWSVLAETRVRSRHPSIIRCH